MQFPSGLAVGRLPAAQHSETSARGQDAALHRSVSVTKLKKPHLSDVKLSDTVEGRKIHHKARITSIMVQMRREG
jgi:hypothetical protein